MDTTYTYSIANDFPTGLVNVANLEREIQTSAIVTALRSVVRDPAGNNSDRLDITFKGALSAGDKTLLDGDTVDPSGGLIALHNSTPVVDIPTVALAAANSLDLTLPVLRTAPTVSRPGFYRCDRDMRLNCGIFNSADSCEDLKINVATNSRVNWGELTLVGIYKDVSGTMTACTDQTDADSNAILSVWDYQAKNGETPIEIEILGGGLAVCEHLSEPVAGDKWKHQIYIIMAPGIPEAYGGRVKFFDGYLRAFEGKVIESVNAMALALKPNPAAGNLNTVIRAYVWYPATAKDSHILRLTTFRQLGNF